MTEHDPPSEDRAPEEARLAALLKEAREDVGSDDDVQALRAALGPTLWPGGDAPGSDAAAGKAGASLAAKLGVTAVIVASGAVLWLATRSTEPVPTPSAVTASSSALPPSVLPMQNNVPLVVQPTPLEGLTRAGDGGAPVPTRAPEENVGGSQNVAPSRPPAPNESTLLGQAQAALSRNPALALSLCEQHRAWFPRGMLVQEREVIAIEALTRSGRRAEAGTRATRFLKAFPRSAYRSKVLSLVPQ
jgi:hypothetical protein